MFSLDVFERNQTALAVIERDLGFHDEKEERRVPACLLRTSEDGGFGPWDHNIPTKEPLIRHFAIAMMKFNLTKITSTKKNQFDLMNFLPVLDSFFGFNKQPQSPFSQELNTMANWERFLGPRWDIIGRDHDILIISMTFCRLRFSSCSDENRGKM